MEHSKFQEKEYVKSFSTWGSSFKRAGKANTGLSISPAEEKRKRRDQKLQLSTVQGRQMVNSPASLQHLGVSPAWQSVGSGDLEDGGTTSTRSQHQLSSHAGLLVCKCHENLRTYDTHAAFLLRRERPRSYHPAHENKNH